MAPRAGFRGRGGRGGGGRGRGRGRGGRGFGKRPRFDSARLAETKDESEAEEESSDESSVPEEPEDTSDAGSDEEAEQATTAKPYMALIKSFTESSGNSAPQAKRRKLDHSGPDETTSRQVDESSDEDRAGDDVDQVDEPEEEPEEVMVGDESDEDDEPDSSDPFETHFAAPDETESSKRLRAVQKGEWKSKRNLDKSLRIVQEEPKDSDFTSLAPISRLSDLKLKQRLHQVMSSKHPELDRAEQRVAPFLFNYHDALYCNRNATNGDSIRRMICLHAVNHVFKTRDRVIKNNARLARDGNEDLELRDQGFTRPKVLVLLPTRQSCVKMVQMMCSICDPDQQENRKRFDDSYTDSEKKFSDDKPSDFRDLFEGNDDDMFRIGVKFTRKTIKYFAQFYNSDILFASPLGLRLAIGSEEDKKLDYDFLSSIEMVIVDQADALLMQNWEHMEYIFEHLNLQPKDAHGCDFSRVRSWYLDNQAKYFRQTVIFSAFNTPELSELFRTHCQNWQGRHRVQPEYPGYLQQLEVKLRQTFLRFDSESVIKEPEDRFSYFTKAVVPTLAKRAKDATGTLIFIPSYLDFVKVRNYFATSSAVANVSFGTISEYADVPEASRARSHFLNGRHKVLLYTERAHHFRRYQLRGVQRIIMYGLPDNPSFYKEIVGGYLSRSEQDLRLEPGTGHVKVMFSKYDVLKLERIVGTERVGKILKAAGDTFDFIS